MTPNLACRRTPSFPAVRIFAVALMSIAATACSSVTPLQAFLKEQGYEPFSPPRGGDGVGTIIDFKSGHESTVASPDPPLLQCVTAEQVPRGNPIPVALSAWSYQVDRNADLELNLAKGLVKNVDMKAAFRDSRVRKVTIELLSPSKIRLTRDSMDSYVKSLPPDSRCYKNMTDPMNFLISDVLAVKGIRYSLLDETNRKITLDATIFSLLNIAPSLSTKFAGSDTLSFDGDVFVGYQLWKVTEAPGIVGAPVRIDDVPPKVVHAGKERSR